MGFVKINPEQLGANPFEAIGKQWMLITAGDTETFNTMTASWGGLGVLWGKNVASVYVRPSRYTFGFMESGNVFTLSFMDESFRDKLLLCGTKSGRDVDKAKVCGFTPVHPPEGGVYFAESETAIICRKVFYQDLAEGIFTDAEVEKEQRSDDMHRVYIAEILAVYTKE